MPSFEFFYGSKLNQNLKWQMHKVVESLKQIKVNVYVMVNRCIFIYVQGNFYRTPMQIKGNN